MWRFFLTLKLLFINQIVKIPMYYKDNSAVKMRGEKRQGVKRKSIINPAEAITVSKLRQVIDEKPIQ